MAKIITWDNRVEDKEQCVFIRGAFYHKERDCHYHDGIYYSPFSRYYVVDHNTNMRVFNLDGKLRYGIVDRKHGEFIFGYYSPNISTNGSVIISAEQSEILLKEIAISKNPQNNYIDILSRLSTNYNYAEECGIAPGITEVGCMDVYTLLKDGYIQVPSSDSIVHNKDTSKCGISMKKSALLQYDFSLAYNSETMMDLFQSHFNKHSFPISKIEDDLANMIGDRTFGVEYESWDGRLPTYEAARNGLIPLRDGSLRHDKVCGYEYATVIMQGCNGIAAIKSQCNALKTFTTFNEKCSMHIHVGNIDKTPENLIRLWSAFYTIQKDIFKMFPACLANTSTYKQKDYCNMLPDLSPLTKDSIVEFLSGGKDRFNKFGCKHPLDPSSQSKWNVPSRYVFCNFNNFYYTDRGTVELRISTPTFNHNKVTALLIIFATIINEALRGVNHTTVESVIDTIKNVKIKSWLLNYCIHRKTVLNQYKIAENGVIYYENISNDESSGNESELY
jgi:hypothetical protein